ncbi:hypothetical protein [Streptomyces sp. NPDC005209]|uniref:hypothetical protein n=1 Tax=Streptomyces sp. NPDC005209 TaxID=3156715 RepID=UPI0033B3501C
MTDVGPASARQRLDAALSGLATTFRGMTARPDEHNCECHWGSAEDLARLKEADTELDPDLLHRTWRAIDWSDHPAVLRRILPQFATALVDGSIEPLFGPEEAGRCFALGHWRRRPAEQAAAVEEFLAAWWVYTLTAADAPRARPPGARAERRGLGDADPVAADLGDGERSRRRPAAGRRGGALGARPAR